MTDVSVIVPVRGSDGELSVTLAALAEQDFDGTFEIIVADNGDNRDLPEPTDRITVVAEPRPGSYAARNAAVERARGEVLAFTDADCRPVPQWLTNGVRRLNGQDGPAFVGGAVAMQLDGPGRQTGAGLWDSVHGLRQDIYVQRDGFSATANLLVRRRDFDRVGRFDDRLMSGGDRVWCHRASAAGLEALYAPDAVVGHPVRASLGELCRKTRRLMVGMLDSSPEQVAGGIVNARSARRLVPTLRSTYRFARDLRRGGRSLAECVRYFGAAMTVQYYGLAVWVLEIRRRRRADASV